MLSFVVWASIVRSRSIHITNLVGKRQGDRYKITCSIVNPTAGEVELTLAPSIMSIRGPKASKLYAVTRDERVILLKPNETRPLKFDLLWQGSQFSVRPEVLARPTSHTETH